MRLSTNYRGKANSWVAHCSITLATNTRGHNVAASRAAAQGATMTLPLAQPPFSKRKPRLPEAAFGRNHTSKALERDKIPSESFTFFGRGRAGVLDTNQAPLRRYRSTRTICLLR